MSIEAVCLLVTTARQLKAAFDADQHNSAEAAHLMAKLRGNTLLISAAVHDGLSSSNPHLKASIEDALSHATQALVVARDAVYDHLLTGRLVRLGTADALRDKLKSAHTQLESDLNDLHRCISLETWRLVVGRADGATGGGGSSGNSGGDVLHLPQSVEAQLADLRAMPNTMCGADKEVVKLLAQLSTSQSKRSSAAGRLAAVVQKRPDSRTAIVEAGGIPAMLKLLSTSGRDEAAQSAAAAVLCMVAGSGPAGADAVVAAGGAAALVALLHEPQGPLLEQAATAARSLATGSPATRAALVDMDGIPALLGLLHRGSEAVQREALEALHHLASAERSHQEAIAGAGGIPHLVGLLGGSGRLERQCTPHGEAVRLAAVRTVSSLASTSSDLRASIASEGGIQALMEVVHDGGNEPAAAQAAEALHNLAADSHALSDAVAAAQAAFN